MKPDDDQGSKGFSPQGSSKKGSSSRSDPAPRPIKKKKKDLIVIERLMEKGLIPLAALDIIRGWMVLEMASSSDMDKALVKASAQNKLGYDSIRQALLAMQEDRDRQSGVGHKGKAKGTMQSAQFIIFRRSSLISNNFAAEILTSSELRNYFTSA